GVAKGSDAHLNVRSGSLSQRLLDHGPGGIFRAIDDNADLVVWIILMQKGPEALAQVRIRTAQRQDHGSVRQLRIPVRTITSEQISPDETPGPKDRKSQEHAQQTKQGQ